MSQKTFKSTENKRAVDLGKVTTGQTSDLIKVWRTTTGEEKAISLGDINGGLIGDYVPYTEAVDDVDLGEKGLSTGYVKYDTTPTATPTDQGTSYWDVDDNTLAIIMNGTILKVGEDQYYPVKNQTGVLIPKGTAVRFAGTLGSSGRLLIAPFIADGSVPSSRFMGVTSEDIGNGEDGKVMWFGRIRGINTNAFNEGDILYASTTVAGGFQTTVPTPPNNIVEVCAVIHKSTSNGIIFVRPTFITSVQAGAGLSLDSLNQIQLGNDGVGVVDISDRDIFEEGFVIKDNGVNSGNRFSLLENELNLELYEVDPIGGDSELFLDWGSSIFRAKVTYFPVEGGKKIQTISIGSNGKGGGIRNPFLMIITDEINSKGFEYTADYSANWTDHSLVTKSWVLGQVSGSAHNPVTIGSPANGLSIDGSQVLTIGLASTSATGALSSTDWNTFNNKLNLTSPITGYEVGANTALADTDTILQAFGKVQGQINARISGSATSGQVAFGTGVNTVGGDSGFVWDNVNKRLNINTTTNDANITLVGSMRMRGVSNVFENGFIQIRHNASNVIDSGLVLEHSRNGVVSTRFDMDSGNIFFSTAPVGSASTLRWSISTIGQLIATGPQTIRTTTGNLAILTSGGNGNILLTPNGTGLVMIGSGTPTNLLDVNGTARIRTISNLGSAATSVLVPSATGVVSLRTLAELAADGGFARETTFQVVSTSGTITDLVATSNRIVFTGASPTINGITGGVDGRTLQILFLGTGTLTFGTGGAANNQFAPSGTNVLGAGCSNEIVYYSGFWRSNDAIGQTVIINRGIFNTQNIISKVGINRTALGGDGSLLIAPTAGSTKCIDIYDGSNNLTGIWDGSGVITCRGVTITNAFNMTFGTTTGTRIGTATNQRLAFWNATPIVQPTTAVASGTLVSNAGTALTNTDTIDGYTLQQVVRALRNTGLLA